MMARLFSACTSSSTTQSLAPPSPTLQSFSQSQLHGSLFGVYVADAVSMPVHWMYDLRLLRKDYTEITGYVAPKERLQGSIMSLSNTGGAGRGSDKGDIVGTVILHGKKKYWARGANYHYHVTLQAGENTLEAQLARLMTRHLTHEGCINVDGFRQQYVDFMRTEGNHNDSYAATAHRMFFKNLVAGKPLAKCPDNDNHNVDAIDALTIVVPVILRYASVDREVRNTNVINAIHSLRNVSSKLHKYAILYADLLVAVLGGADLKEQVAETATKLGIRDLPRQVSSSSGDPMAACYIDGSFSALLFLAYKYGASVEEAVLGNANAGGENVARGALLGALVGAAYGMEGFPEWTKQGLFSRKVIDKEIDAFLESYTDVTT